MKTSVENPTKKVKTLKNVDKFSTNGFLKKEKTSG